jgi:hypothetical protein
VSKAIKLRDDETAIQLEGERLEASSDVFEETSEVSPADRLRFRQSMGLVLSVRFDEQQLRALAAEARRRGLAASTLVRMWTLERLEECARVQAGGVGHNGGTHDQEQ